jgi:transposase
LIAVGHKILIMCYEILKRKAPYRELGADFLDKRKKEKIVRSYVNRLSALGYEVTVKQAA